MTSANPDTNYHASTLLGTDNAGSGSPFEHTLIVPLGLEGIPSTAIVAEAKLRVRVVDASPAEHGVYAITESWDASTVTWNSRPSSSSAAVSTYLPSSIAAISIDVTSLAQQWIDGSAALHGVLLRMTATIDTNGTWMSSAEDAGNGPVFEVKYDIPLQAPPRAGSSYACSPPACRPTLR